MREVLLIFIFFSSSFSFAQFSCPSNLIYGIGGSSSNPFIGVYNPALPSSANNPSYTTIPPPAGNRGLALISNINGGSPSPTLYSIFQSNHNFCYWNGSVWVDTGHYSYNSNTSALGGCNTYLYYVNATPQLLEIYRYDGTSNATLLTTISLSSPSFGDIVADCYCNFYILTQNELLKYNANGQLLTTYNVINPILGGAGAYSIIGDTIYVGGSSVNSLFKGVITGNSINYLPSSVSTLSLGASDFASCPMSTIVSTQASINSGTLGCNPPSLNLAVNATLSPLNYNWSGAGIGTSVPGTSVMSVNAPGIYTCELTHLNCNYVLATVVSTIISNTTVVTPQILPALAVCINTEPLISSISGSNYINQWLNASGGIVNSPSLAASTAGTYTLKVTEVSNGCYGTATASILPAPQLTLGLSSNTMCVYAHDMNRVIVLTPSGAMHYSIYTSPGYTAPIHPSQPIIVQQIPPVNALGGVSTATLVGSNGACSSSVSANFTVLPASKISVSPSITTVCKNTNQTFQASGTNLVSYVWQPQYALNTVNNNKVTASINAALTLSVSGIDKFGCGTAIFTVSADVYPDVQGYLNNYADTYCAPFCATFSFSPAFGVAAKSSWQIENKTYSKNTFTHCFSSAGDYVIKGILTDSVHRCSNAVTFSVQAYPRPVADFNFEPKQPVEGNHVLFQNTTSGSNTAVWFFSESDFNYGEFSSFFYEEAGLYPVAMLAKNEFGCQDTMVKAIKVFPEFLMYIPNTFTPNNDNLNDEFKVVTRGLKSFSMIIYNRWGNKLFESSDHTKGWDGTYSGTPCPTGIYTWKIIASTEQDEEKVFTGTVMLER